jgi:hypothetical protein
MTIIILIHLLVKCNHFLNLHVVGICTLDVDGPSIFFFDTPILSAKVDEGLLSIKLSFFHC